MYDDVTYVYDDVTYVYDDVTDVYLGAFFDLVRNTEIVAVPCAPAYRVRTRDLS